MAEFLLNFLRGMTENLKDFFLNFRIGNPDTAAADLKAVENKIVLPGTDFQRLFSQKRNIGVFRRGKRMVHGINGPLRRFFKKRKVNNKTKGQFVRIIFIFSQIWLVSLILLHHLLVSQPRKRRLADFLGRHQLGHQSRKKFFGKIQDFFLAGKGHLQIELGKFTVGPVGPGILVAETASDLVISFQSGDHQQLFVLLRRLG